LAQALRDPTGFGSSDALRVWLFEQHGSTMRTDAWV
jgi:hypothetical protein